MSNHASNARATWRPLRCCALGIVALALSGVAGCGEERLADDRAATRAVVQLQRAFAAGDLGALCARMTPAARRQAARFAHGRRASCPSDLHEALAIAMPAAVRETRPPPRVDSAEVDGDRAVVSATAQAGGAFDVPLARRGGRWRLDAFLGTAPNIAKATTADLREQSFPEAGDAAAVRVSQAGIACFPLSDDAFPRIDNGCGAMARGRGVRLLIDTPFGRYDFGSCDIGYSVSIGPTGRAWMHGVTLTAAANNGCADVGVCRDEEGNQLPWKGRIVARPGDRFEHLIDACFDTCVGFYVWRLALGISRTDGAWRVTADRARVGRSGLLLDGHLALGPGDVALVATRRGAPVPSAGTTNTERSSE
jgi:hypothetical protein